MSLQSNRNRQGWASRIADLMIDQYESEPLGHHLERVEHIPDGRS